MATVTVRGAASVAATPDEASVSVELSGLRNTPEEAYASVAERSEELARLLDELTIERSRRSTGGVSVRAESEYVDGRQQHRGYRATARTVLRLTDAAVVARLLRDAVSRVDARVEGPWWVVRPENPARLEAARAAALDARSRAEAYADALGVRLGALKRVQEPRRGGGARSFEGDMVLSAARSAEPAAVDVAPGEHRVSAAVDVTYLLEPV